MKLRGLFDCEEETLGGYKDRTIITDFVCKMSRNGHKFTIKEIVNTLKHFKDRPMVLNNVKAPDWKMLRVEIPRL